jgi:uncharacterized protein YfaS (alpha-2-macroglobulin family)
VPRLVVATDHEEYKPGSPLLIKVKSSSPGTVTVAVISPDGRTVFKEDVRTSDLGEAVSDYRIGEDAPAGDWKVVAYQGDAEARVGFHVIR